MVYFLLWLIPMLLYWGILYVWAYCPSWDNSVIGEFDEELKTNIVISVIPVFNLCGVLLLVMLLSVSLFFSKLKSVAYEKRKRPLV